MSGFRRTSFVRQEFSVTRSPLAAVASSAAVLVAASALAAVQVNAVTAAPSAAPVAPSAAPAEELLTGFEQRDGASWTTLPEERSFLRDLDAASERVAVSRIGRTGEGRAIQLITVGDPAPHSRAEIADGSAILYICSQHGDEPSGREACLQLARDLASDTSTSTARFLQRSTVLFIPTANPDGRAADTRENADGVDVNRDHLALATPEGRAMARTFNRYQPDLVHDLHEYGPTPDVYDRQLIHLWPRNRNVDTGVYEHSVELNEDYVAAQVKAAGYSTGIYGIWYDEDGEPIAQVAGDGDERILRNNTGLRHAAGILVEANSDPTTPGEAADESALNRRRVETQLIAASASIDFVRENRAALATSTAQARERAVQDGATGGGVLAFDGADNELPSPSAIDTTPPCAYRLSSAQFSEVQRTLRLHRIDSTREGGDRVVSMAQASSTMIPMLLDERGLHNLVAGTPVDC